MQSRRRARALALAPLLWITVLPRAVCDPDAAAAWYAGGAQLPLRGGNVQSGDGLRDAPLSWTPHGQGHDSAHDHALDDHLHSIEHSPPDAWAANDDSTPPPFATAHLAPDISPTLQALLAAVNVMQDHFFEVWRGSWPSAIDWTAAVLGTQVSGAMNAITQSPAYTPKDAPFGDICENTIAGYFSHVSSFYFGENAFDLRLQANDDMLWVVLEWLEAIRFIRTHSDAHYTEDREDTTTKQHDGDFNSSWYARHFIPAYAHRSRIFWDLAHKGWDTTLCGGGMIWNPDLIPYKNAITNQLYIAASISMYLYSPGDENGFPFSQSSTDGDKDRDMRPLPPIKPHDERYLQAAQVAYEWLMDSGMTNVQGLFVDGFHIRGWRPGHDGTGKCDVRNEMVYTYNQGVILTGQRGLWRATGNTSYLDAGHALISNVIKASGWQDDGAHFPFWAGLGRNGVMEERCDAFGSCSQNGQTFKGIFFHHLAEFCTELEQDGDGSEDGGSGDDEGQSDALFETESQTTNQEQQSARKVFHPATPEQVEAHSRRCNGYAPWIARNARAAVGTRNGNGEFGEWWTVGLGMTEFAEDDTEEDDAASRQPEAKWNEDLEVEVEVEDYRNLGLPFSTRWQRFLSASHPVRLPGTAARLPNGQSLHYHDRQHQDRNSEGEVGSKDVNDRGRGRTVETQSGGVAVLKALYALVERRMESRRQLS